MWSKWQFYKPVVLFFVILTPVIGCCQENIYRILVQSKEVYPSLKAKQAEVGSNSKQVKASRMDYLPLVLLQDQYTFSTNNNMTGSFFPNESLGISTTGAALAEDVYKGVYGSLASVTVDWKVFSFGKVRSVVEISKSNLQVAVADYENELFQHQIQVADAYLAVLLHQKLVTAQVHNVNRAGEIKEVVVAGAAAGLRSGVDSMLANAEWAKAQMQLSEHKRNLKNAQARLAELLATSTDVDIDSMLFYQKVPTDTAIPTMNIHPRLALYRSQADVSHARAKMAKLNALPVVSLVASGLARGSGNSRVGGKINHDFSGASYGLYNYLFGVAFRWNLTGFAKSRYDYGSEKLQTEKFQYLYEEQELTLKRQSREADAQLEVAKEHYRLAPIQLQAASNAFYQEEARYKNGLADLTPSIKVIIS